MSPTDSGNRVTCFDVSESQSTFATKFRGSSALKIGFYCRKANVLISYESCKLCRGPWVESVGWRGGLAEMMKHEERVA